MRREAWEAVVIGGGPAGLAAGMHLSRAGYRTLLIERARLGGRAGLLDLIENYPGFPEGISGRALMDLWARQARRWGLAVRRAEALGIRRSEGGFAVSLAQGPSARARAVVFCPGASFKRLGGEGRLWGKGVYDAALGRAYGFRGRLVAVVGGGEAAAHQALLLARHARRVYLICRSGRIKAHRLLLRRLASCPRVVFFPGTRVEGLLGGRRLEGVRLSSRDGARPGRLKVSALFVLIGQEAAPCPLGAGKGAPGFFTAGDASGGISRQVAVAGGDGLRAAMRCIRYLEGLQC